MQMVTVTTCGMIACYSNRAMATNILHKYECNSHYFSKRFRGESSSPQPEVGRELSSVIIFTFTKSICLVSRHMAQ